MDFIAVLKIGFIGIECTGLELVRNACSASRQGPGGADGIAPSAVAFLLILFYKGFIYLFSA